MSEKPSLEEQFARQRELLKKGDPKLWRQALSEATMDMLSSGQPVTVESLIERLEKGFGDADPILRPASAQQAIENLRAIQAAKSHRQE
jgi:hypothetical protein